MSCLKQYTRPQVVLFVGSCWPGNINILDNFPVDSWAHKTIGFNKNINKLKITQQGPLVKNQVPLVNSENGPVAGQPNTMLTLLPLLPFVPHRCFGGAV